MPMQRAMFQYELPEALIAQSPLPERTASRLLTLDGASGACRDGHFHDLETLLQPGDLLVLNDTRVIPARLFGHKASGGRVEMLIERVLDEHRALAFMRASKPCRTGLQITLEGGGAAQVISRDGDLYELQFDSGGELTAYLEQHGHMPLPPYIHRADNTSDRRRYQTVFARCPGAVAAPTAGLHFDQAMLQRLGDKGVAECTITLHVGAGTFVPLRVEQIEDHQMHSERVEVTPSVCQAITETRERGGRVIAVGTTSVRALESAAAAGEVEPFSGETKLFLYPGCQFRVVDALLTNFHLPESTLLMLVCAFAGTQAVLDAYRHAVEEGYRFFSYGDAMFLTRKP